MWLRSEWRFQELEGILLHILLHQTSESNTDYGVWALFADWKDTARTKWSLEAHTGLQLPEHDDSDAISAWLENKSKAITWSIRGRIKKYQIWPKVLRDGQSSRQWHGKDDEEGAEEDEGIASTGIFGEEQQRLWALDMRKEAGGWSEQEDQELSTAADLDIPQFMA
jgi:hypothetical protein